MYLLLDACDDAGTPILSTSGAPGNCENRSLWGNSTYLEVEGG